MHRWKQALILLLLLTVYTLAEGAFAGTTPDGLERQVHGLVNKHRAAQGLKPLTFNPEISAIARRHSQDMATGGLGLAMLEPQPVNKRSPELSLCVGLRRTLQQIPQGLRMQEIWPLPIG